MACILNIETSTKVCSVALAVDGITLFNKENYTGPSHAASLGVYAEEAVAEAKRQNIAIDAIAVSSGPGSYTGLRIGVSLAKGLCYGYGVPLISVPTLRIMSGKVIKLQNEEDAFYCPMIDARRMEVYASVYNNAGKEVVETKAVILEENTFDDLLSQKKVFFFGDGSSKYSEILKHSGAVFIEEIAPLANDMVELSERLFNEKQFENAAYYEPFYLKEFQATVAKNKVLG